MDWFRVGFLLVVVCAVAFPGQTMALGERTVAEVAAIAGEQAGAEFSGTVEPARSPPTAEQADNPWGKDTVTVALRSNHDGERDYAPALASAIEYWNEHPQYGTYTVEFVFVEDPDEADIHVDVTESVDRCGNVERGHVLGCAPLLTENSRVDPPVTVAVQAGFTQRSTRAVMIHEFGHLLGIRHGEKPRKYMQHRQLVVPRDLSGSLLNRSR